MSIPTKPNSGAGGKTLKTIHPNHVAPPKNFCRLPNGYGVIKIGVSGAADTTYSGLEAFEKAKEIGREIAKQGAIITTGATTGFPMYAAMGAKDECGFSIGFSPAATEREHAEVYKLPLDYRTHQKINKIPKAYQRIRSLPNSGYTVNSLHQKRLKFSDKVNHLKRLPTNECLQR